MAKPNTRGPWLKNPKRPRNGETIGGGYFVFRRGKDTNRIRPSQWPFEYDTAEAALEQARALAKAHPGYVFQVVHVIDGAFALAEPAEAQAA